MTRPLRRRARRARAAGTYLFKVYATDNAGNTQATVGSNKLVVK